MISRMHPVCNWVRIAPHEHRQALDKVLQFRDAAPEPMASGMPEAAVQWFWMEELPRLMKRPEVRAQALERLAELSAKRQELEQQIRLQAGALIEQQAELDQERALIEQVLP
jgi:hypothetical protein